MYNVGYQQNFYEQQQGQLLSSQRNHYMSSFYGDQTNYTQGQPNQYFPHNYIAQNQSHLPIPSTRYGFEQGMQYDQLAGFKDVDHAPGNFGNGQNDLSYNQSMLQRFNQEKLLKNKHFQQLQQQQFLQQQQNSLSKQGSVVAEDVMSNGLPILLKRDENYLCLQQTGSSKSGNNCAKEAPMWSFSSSLASSGVQANSLQRKIQENQVEKNYKGSSKGIIGQLSSPQHNINYQANTDMDNRQQPLITSGIDLGKQPQVNNFINQSQGSQGNLIKANDMVSPNISYNTDLSKFGNNQFQNPNLPPNNLNQYQNIPGRQRRPGLSSGLPPAFGPNVSQSPAAQNRVNNSLTQPHTPHGMQFPSNPNLGALDSQISIGTVPQMSMGPMTGMGGPSMSQRQAATPVVDPGLNNGQQVGVAGQSMGPYTGGQVNDQPKSSLYAQQLLANIEKIKEKIGQLPDEDRISVETRTKFLTMLCHCNQCTDTACKEYQKCQSWRDNFRHFTKCKDPGCQVSQCSMAKGLMQHFKSCKDDMCLVCAPVKIRMFRRRQPKTDINQIKQQSATSLQKSSLQVGKVSSDKTKTITQLNQKAAPSVSKTDTKQQAGVDMIDKTNNVHEAKEEAEISMKMKDPNKEQNNMGTSLIEAFNTEQIDQHILSTRNCFLTAKPQKEKDFIQYREDDLCLICKHYNLNFEPPSVWCSMCSKRILKGQIFYSHQMELGDYKPHFCHSCVQDQKGPTITHENLFIRKIELTKEKNEKEVDESWVQCDTCNRWVHQICGLFNKGKNNQESHYKCPCCLKEGLENGQREPIKNRPQSMLEAKDLSCTYLSDWLERRVLKKLQVERETRASVEEKNVEDIPTADNLTIRIVNNVVKKAEVKSKFREAFRGENSHLEFAYRQRVIILFQKIEGVDVILYVMYVQEYGDDAPSPNKGTVYLSYLDSVKYFRPEISMSQKNIALRTMCYFEIILGYLEFIKQQGFQSMFIWACPPLQGDDYILYCHPSKQRTPSSNRLRDWYHQVLQEAKSQNLITGVTTLFDLYFEKGRDHRVDKITAQALPYYDGDYWPGEAEILLGEIQAQKQAEQQAAEGNQEVDNNIGDDQGTLSRDYREAKNQQSKNNMRKQKLGKRQIRYTSEPLSTDHQLIRRLEKTIGDMKEDFIVVHIQEPCSFCRKYINGGHRYALTQDPNKLPPVSRKDNTFEGIQLEGSNPTTVPPKFQLCEPCYQEEQAKLLNNGRSKLPGSLKIEHLTPIATQKIDMQPDHDPVIESEFFSTRIQFLSLCQGNHYQFDTIRRAKHSSMMVLYHIHNPNAPAYVSTCNECSQEVEPGQGYRCTICSDYDMCGECYAKDKHSQHRSALRKQQNANVDETQVRLSDQQRRERKQYLERSLQVLVHAASCKDPQCPQKSCKKIQLLWAHATTCELKVPGGCKQCRRMWCLLSLHAKFCQNSMCMVPRCKELKELVRRSNQRQEDQRRAAYHQFTAQRRQATALEPKTKKQKIG